MVIEGDSSLTTSDMTLLCNPSSVNLEGGPSYVHLDDYIEWNPPRVVPRGFPLMFGHTVTLTYLRPLGKSGGPGEHPQDNDVARPGILSPCRKSTRRGNGVTFDRESLLVSAS